MNKCKLTIATIFAIALGLTGTDSLSAQTVWLDELDLSTATQGYGIPVKNKSEYATIGADTLRLCSDTSRPSPQNSGMWHPLLTSCSRSTEISMGAAQLLTSTEVSAKVGA